MKVIFSLHWRYKFFITFLIFSITLISLVSAIFYYIISDYKNISTYDEVVRFSNMSSSFILRYSLFCTLITFIFSCYLVYSYKKDWTVLIIFLPLNLALYISHFVMPPMVDRAKLFFFPDQGRRFCGTPQGAIIMFIAFNLFITTMAYFLIKGYRAFQEYQMNPKR
jgi:hypothetical protein